MQLDQPVGGHCPRHRPVRRPSCNRHLLPAGAGTRTQHTNSALPIPGPPPWQGSAPHRASANIAVSSRHSASHLFIPGVVARRYSNGDNDSDPRARSSGNSEGPKRDIRRRAQYAASQNHSVYTASTGDHQVTFSPERATARDQNGSYEEHRERCDHEGTAERARVQQRGQSECSTDRYVHRYVHPVASGEVVCDPVLCHVATMATTMTPTKYVKAQAPPRLL